MAHKRSWIDEPTKYPALMPPYVCPCCHETRQSVQYGGETGYTCAECAWDYCGGEHKNGKRPS